MDLNKLFEAILSAEYRQAGQDASYAVLREGDRLTVLFEKSNGATDWRNNLDFPARAYGKHDLWFVHRGFLRVFKAAEPCLAPYIADKDIRHIVVAGYSHGAALALLCHEYAVFRRPDIASDIEGYGFGCPRVVWGPIGSRVRARFARFTVIRNCRDLVTRLPPVLFGFRHVGAMLSIGRGETYGPVSSHEPDPYRTELKKFSEGKGGGAAAARPSAPRSAFLS